MNWKKSGGLAALYASGFAATFAAGNNFASMSTEGTSAGPGDYAIYAGGPILLAFIASLGRFLVRFFSNPNDAAVKVEDEVEDVLAEQVAKLTKKRKTEAARALLAATDVIQGRT